MKSSIENIDVKIIAQTEQAIKSMARFLTEDEQKMFARRILVAKMLARGEQYRKISNDLDIGFDTIRQVRLWLVGGSRTGRAPRRGYMSSSNTKRSKQSTGHKSFLDRYPSRNILVKKLLRNDK